MVNSDDVGMQLITHLPVPPQHMSQKEWTFMKLIVFLNLLEM